MWSLSPVSYPVSKQLLHYGLMANRLTPRASATETNSLGGQIKYSVQFSCHFVEMDVENSTLRAANISLNLDVYHWKPMDARGLVRASKIGVSNGNRKFGK